MSALCSTVRGEQVSSIFLLGTYIQSAIRFRLLHCPRRRVYRHGSFPSTSVYVRYVIQELCRQPTKASARRNAGVDRTCRSQPGPGMLGPIAHTDHDQPEECTAAAGLGRSHIPITTSLRNAGQRQAGVDRAYQSWPGPGMQRAGMRGSIGNADRRQPEECSVRNAARRNARDPSYMPIVTTRDDEREVEKDQSQLVSRRVERYERSRCGKEGGLGHADE
ncbi:hypothetical protein CALVIDRAFT_384913 [Calocera viscosa TUFC12733]|uniref:Uncharacterized protein n=1 Tax=Calocera viscosa (strain TUFC12733) TaxID=1330018 RepID=A0A167Q8I7_CALVF|nr:hypothetical protein CALVIDRAFT_384913 [Calocera viscosa TUFC12733]